jgi:peptidoglycan/xylan/chitin deacetylase (PgdA/CDA1 family)
MLPLKPHTTSIILFILILFILILFILILFITGCEGKANPLSQTHAVEIQNEHVLSNKSKAIQTIPRVYTDSIPILMYHSIGLKQHNSLFVPPKVFEEQMEHLKKAGYHTLSFKDLKEWKTGKAIPDKPILITFDDGYLDNFTIVYPILRRFQMKATIFVSSDFIGFPNHLNWVKIKEMEQSGYIEIGVHTRHHVDLTKQSPVKLKDEIMGAKHRLDEKLGRETIAFAYPSGKYNHNVVEVVKRAGFEFAVTKLSGRALQKQGYLTLHRVRVPGNQSLTNYVRKFP